MIAPLSLVVQDDQMCHGYSVCDEKKKEITISITVTDTGVRLTAFYLSLPQ